MNLEQLFDYSRFLELVEDGYINLRSHPHLKLTIGNYSAKTQYEQNWVPETIQSRGLIFDSDLKIVARGFPKFKNWSEHQDLFHLLDEPCTASLKIDGSLILIYPTIGDGYACATRGSFASDQAIAASNYLDAVIPWFSAPKDISTLCEWIGPSNKIVVPYDKDRLVLLGAIDNETGEDIPLDAIDWWINERTTVYPDICISDCEKLVESDDFQDQEGLVLTWFKKGKPSVKVKIKREEYIRLHRILTNFSPKRVWEALSSGDDFLKLLDDVPDEWYGMVHEIQNNLIAQYDKIYTEAIENYQRIGVQNSRGNFAEIAKTYDNPGLLFCLLDGKSVEDKIWKMIEPKGS